jgi:protein-S-isoprenylcysteine O-methyltransferase Ste14
MLLAAACMWVLHRWLPLGRWLAPPWNRAGAVPAAAGIALAAAALLRFRAARTTVNPLDPGKASQLVTGGVFRLSRNPMYLGLTLLLIGWALWLGSASPWVVPPLFVLVMTVAQIIPEEQALGRLFGEPYADYRRRVARWIGRPR